MKTVDEINEKIKRGEAVVLTAEEVVELAREKSPEKIAEQVDVVTTGTFAPMCSSGAVINFGHTTPPMRMEKIELAGVEVYGSLAAVDGFLGATEESKTDKSFGGAHIIEALIEGRDLYLKAAAKGTDCYPRREFEGYINKDMINDFFLFNPRNAYQNYAAATNSSDRTKYTYMGKLLPHFGNVTYSTSGELSPLLKDLQMITIGLGTRIFLGGGTGYVVWPGTQFRNDVRVNQYGLPVGPARTLAVIGDARRMSSRYLRAAYFKNYGVTLLVGIGVPIPVLNEEVAYFVSRSNEEIETIIEDYGRPERPIIAGTNYARLREGWLELNGKRVKTSPLSSLLMAREISQVLKERIIAGSFLLTSPVEFFREERTLKQLEIRTSGEELKLEKPTCVDCGACVSVCAFDALNLVDGKFTYTAEKCTDCGECADVCPLGVELPPHE